jgi:F5/8 type C domain
MKPFSFFRAALAAQAFRLGLSFALAGIPMFGPATSFAQTPPPVYPKVGPTTHFVNQDAVLSGFPEPAWYQANVPFIDLPDQTIENVYYYRWRVAHEAQKYTGAKNGWIVTEFLGPVFYSAPYGGISAAAGHHIAEARWIRDQRYLDDYIRFWLTGDGASAKPANDSVNPNTTDWAHEYSFWAGSAVLQRVKVTGNVGFAIDLLPQLIAFYNGWSGQFNQQLGLYWQTPVWDAMEYSASSYQSPDPYHGGDGYRPTINAYQFGDAKAISLLAALKGDLTTSIQFIVKAAQLQQAQDQHLWDSSTDFYKHVMLDNNPDLIKIVDREEIGFVPWMFEMPAPNRSVAWTELLDPQGFFSDFSTTTVERRSPWFMYQAASGCCHWDGPVWPYATSQTLNGMANLLIDYPPQTYVTKQDYYNVLSAYAFAQQKNGQPYVAEAHDPDQAFWIYDTPNHSEDYNHSTFNDLVLSGLLGIRPQLTDTLVINPLVPDSWNYFAVENVAYHGRNISIVWDRDGSHYQQGAGFRVYIDGNVVMVKSAIQPVVIPVPPGPPQNLPLLVNDAVNAWGGPLSPAPYPIASASYTSPYDDAQRAIDGQVAFLDIPNTRWTDYGSPNPTDWWSLNFGQVRPVSDIRIYFYNDNGGVKPPASYELQYLDANGQWQDIPNQNRQPATPVGNDLNRITFPTISTQNLRIIVTPQAGAWAGFSEFESWRPE